MSKKSKSKKRKQRKILRIILVILIILLSLTAGVVGAGIYLLGNLNTVDLDASDEDLGVSGEGVKGITNIALYGVDTRDMSSSHGLSDAIIILTVDKDNNVVKMTSVLRDSKVPIEGYGERKINSAYSLGGPTLAIKTLNQNFDLDIKEYVTVNFAQLAEIVDSVGGVTVNLTPAEVSETNRNMQETAKGEPQVQSSGDVLLTGPQAVAYSRIRSIGNDNERASRQQEVLNAVFDKIMTMPKSEYPDFIRKFLGIVETSLDYGDMLALSPIAVSGFTIENYAVPDAEFETDLWGGIDETGAWVWTYDLDRAAARIHHIIYGTAY
ncbi:MAG: LCP family protein [Firmicutes bacterium]|nr:LCP family protein [Bacillota bacterium]